MFSLYFLSRLLVLPGWSYLARNVEKMVRQNLAGTCCGKPSLRVQVQRCAGLIVVFAVGLHHLPSQISHHIDRSFLVAPPVAASLPGSVALLVRRLWSTFITGLRVLVASRDAEPPACHPVGPATRSVGVAACALPRHASPS